MNRDCARDGVVLRVDDGNGTLPARRAGVDHIDLVARGADGHRDRILPNRNLAVEAHIYHVDHGDRAAAAVGHVRVLAIAGRVLRKVVRAAAGEGERKQREGDEAGDCVARRVHDVIPAFKS
jgi:hypothetical protein